MAGKETPFVLVQVQVPDGMTREEFNRAIKIAASIRGTTQKAYLSRLATDDPAFQAALDQIFGKLARK